MFLSSFQGPIRRTLNSSHKQTPSLLYPRAIAGPQKCPRQNDKNQFNAVSTFLASLASKFTSSTLHAYPLCVNANPPSSFNTLRYDTHRHYVVDQARYTNCRRAYVFSLNSSARSFGRSSVGWEVEPLAKHNLRICYRKQQVIQVSEMSDVSGLAQNAKHSVRDSRSISDMLTFGCHASYWLTCMRH